MRTARGLTPIVLVALLAILLVAPGSASAAKVGNPGAFNATVTEGTLRVKAQTFNFDGSGDPIRFGGQINAQGQITNGTVSFPPQNVNASGVDVTVRINPGTSAPGPVSGTINPLTGVASIRLRVWIKIDGVPFGGGCRIADANNPIDVNALITGTTNPPGPNTPITGTPYNINNGTLKVVNNSFSVPSATDCGPAEGTVNSSLGLPSAAGNNEAQFTSVTSPILARALIARVTATPSAGVVPLNVAFNANTTTNTAAIQSYAWDFEGNGTFDRTTAAPTTSFVYSTPGTYQARLRVTDADGDISDVTQTVTANPPGPELSITKSHTGDFRVGTPGVYTVAVSNASIGATTGAVTVTDTLPAGLTYQSATGSGWSCGAAGPLVTCTRPSVAGSSTAPPITLTVGVGTAAVPGVTNTATVQTAGDPTPGDNSDADPTTVNAVDLSIDKSHEGTFRPGPGNEFTLAVRNEGSAPTFAPATVTDTLPAGLTFVGANGTGWSCGASGQTVTCTRPAGLAAAADAPEITLEVAGSLPIGQTSASVTNSASVSTTDDADPSDNTDSDDVQIVDAPDLAIVKSHGDNFTAGSQEDYSIAVRNTGPQPTSGPTVVTDTLPAGLTFVSATGTGWACGASGQDVTCTRNASLPADTAAPAITLRVDVGLAAIPSVVNTASVAAVVDPNAANDSSSDPTLVRAIDLVVDKSHAGPLRVNRSSPYRLRVTNQGGSATVGPTTITDTLPAGLTFVSATGTGWSCGASGQTVTCTYAAAIPGGGTDAPDVALTVAVAPSAPNSVSNTATVATEDDFQPSNNSDTDVTPVIEVDVAIAKTHLGELSVGATRTYTLSVDSVGSVPTSGAVVVSDTLPAGLSFVSASGTGWSCSASGQDVTCSLPGGLPAETPARDIALRVLVGPAAVPSVTNTATVVTPGDRNGANDSSSDSAAVAAPDVTSSSVHTGRFRVGAVGTYTLGAANPGTGPTTGTTTLVDTLPASLAFEGATGAGWSCAAAGQVVTCAYEDSIPAGGAAPAVTLRARPLASAPASVSNQVSVSTPGDSNTQNNGASDTTGIDRIDLQLRLGRGGPFAVNRESIYSVLVSNEGTAPTAGPIRVTDTLPAGVTPLGASGEGWACGTTGQLVTCEHPGPLAGDAAAPVLAIRVKPLSSAPGTITNTVSVSTTDDVNPVNDSDTDSTSPGRDPDLELDLAQAGELRAGGTGALEVGVRNLGGSSAPGPTTVVTSLAPGLSFSGSTGAGWSCIADGTEVTCSRGSSIPEGGRSDFSIEFGVAALAAPQAGANATASNAADPNPSNDSDAVTMPVTAVDLALVKSHAGDWAAGGTGTFRLEVANEGSAATVGPARITETLPAGITFSSASGTGWGCSASAQGLTCTHPASIPAGADAAPLTVTVDVAEAAVPGVTSTATVSTADDTDPSNDSSTDSVGVSTGRPPVATPVVRPASIAAGTLRLTRSGFVSVRLACPAEATVRCSGTLTLVSAKKVKSGKKRLTLALGSAPYTVATGRTLPVTVKVPKKAAKAILALRKLAAKATATSAGVPTATAKLTLKPPKG